MTTCTCGQTTRNLSSALAASSSPDEQLYALTAIRDWLDEVRPSNFNPLTLGSVAILPVELQNRVTDLVTKRLFCDNLSAAVISSPSQSQVATIAIDIIYIIVHMINVNRWIHMLLTPELMDVLVRIAADINHPAFIPTITILARATSTDANLAIIALQLGLFDKVIPMLENYGLQNEVVGHLMWLAVGILDVFPFIDSQKYIKPITNRCVKTFKDTSVETIGGYGSIDRLAMESAVFGLNTMHVSGRTTVFHDTALVQKAIELNQRGMLMCPSLLNAFIQFGPSSARDAVLKSGYIDKVVAASRFKDTGCIDLDAAHYALHKLNSLAQCTPDICKKIAATPDHLQQLIDMFADTGTSFQIWRPLSFFLVTFCSQQTAALTDSQMERIFEAVIWRYTNESLSYNFPASTFDPLGLIISNFKELHSSDSRFRQLTAEKTHFMSTVVSELQSVIDNTDTMQSCSKYAIRAFFFAERLSSLPYDLQTPPSKHSRGDVIDLIYRLISHPCNLVRGHAYGQMLVDFDRYNYMTDGEAGVQAVMERLTGELRHIALSNPADYICNWSSCVCSSLACLIRFVRPSLLQPLVSVFTLFIESDAYCGNESKFTAVLMAALNNSLSPTAPEMQSIMSTLTSKILSGSRIVSRHATRLLGAYLTLVADDTSYSEAIDLATLPGLTAKLCTHLKDDSTDVYMRIELCEVICTLVKNWKSPIETVVENGLVGTLAHWIQPDSAVSDSATTVTITTSGFHPLLAGKALTLLQDITCSDVVTLSSDQILPIVSAIEYTILHGVGKTDFLMVSCATVSPSISMRYPGAVASSIHDTVLTVIRRISEPPDDSADLIPSLHFMTRYLRGTLSYMECETMIPLILPVLSLYANTNDFVAWSAYWLLTELVNALPHDAILEHLVALTEAVVYATSRFGTCPPYVIHRSLMLLESLMPAIRTTQRTDLRLDNLLSMIEIMLHPDLSPYIMVNDFRWNTVSRLLVLHCESSVKLLNWHADRMLGNIQNGPSFITVKLDNGVLIRLLSSRLGCLAVSQYSKVFVAGLEHANHDIVLHTIVTIQTVIDGRRDVVIRLLLDGIFDSLSALAEQKNMSHSVRAKVIELLYDMQIAIGPPKPLPPPLLPRPPPAPPPPPPLQPQPQRQQPEIDPIQRVVAARIREALTNLLKPVASMSGFTRDIALAIRKIVSAGHFDAVENSGILPMVLDHLKSSNQWNQAWALQIINEMCPSVFTSSMLCPVINYYTQPERFEVMLDFVLSMPPCLPLRVSGIVNIALFIVGREPQLTRLLERLPLSELLDVVQDPDMPSLIKDRLFYLILGPMGVVGGKSVLSPDETTATVSYIQRTLFKHSSNHVFSFKAHAVKVMWNSNLRVPLMIQHGVIDQLFALATSTDRPGTSIARDTISEMIRHSQPIWQGHIVWQLYSHAAKLVEPISHCRWSKRSNVITYILRDGLNLVMDADTFWTIYFDSGLVPLLLSCIGSGQPYFLRDQADLLISLIDNRVMWDDVKLRMALLVEQNLDEIIRLAHVSMHRYPAVASKAYLSLQLIMIWFDDVSKPKFKGKYHDRQSAVNHIREMGFVEIFRKMVVVKRWDQPHYIVHCFHEMALRLVAIDPSDGHLTDMSTDLILEDAESDALYC